jgi:hypothetical protein
VHAGDADRSTAERIKVSARRVVSWMSKLRLSIRESSEKRDRSQMCRAPLGLSSRQTVVHCGCVEGGDGW